MFRIVSALGLIPRYSNIEGCSLIPRPSITANVVEGVVKLLRRMASGRRWEAWLIVPCNTLAMQFTGSATPLDVHLMSFYVEVLPGLPPH